MRAAGRRALLAFLAVTFGARGDYPCTEKLLPISPRSTQTVCTTLSRSTVLSTAPGGTWDRAAFRTRVTGRVPGGAIVLDRTVDSLEPPLKDATVTSSLDQARWLLSVAGSPAATQPILVSSSDTPVTSLVLEVPTLEHSSSLTALPPIDGPGLYCVGDLGHRPAPPEALLPAPCPPGAEVVSLTIPPLRLPPIGQHLHERTVLHSTTTMTAPGVLTTSHYEVVGTTATSTLTIPFVLSAEGLGGASFTSELTLTNRGETDASVTLRYTSAFGGSSGTARDTLRAGTQRIVPDAVAYLRDLGIPVGDSGSRGGTLQVTFEGLSAFGAAAATVRTTTAVRDGRVGVAYAGMLASKLLSFPVTIPGLRQYGADRSNVAVLNAGSPGDGNVTLRLTVVSGDSTDPKTQVLPDVTLSPGGFRQLSGILAAGGLTVRNGIVTVERIAGTAPFYAYGVINDEANGDGSFVEPVRTSPMRAIPRTTLPVVVESPDYETEVVLTNLTGVAHDLRLEFVPAGSTTLDVSLRPHEQQILPGFVQLLRDRGVISGLRGRTMVGALFATDLSGDLRGISIAARASTPGSGGRYGLFYSAVPTGAEATTSAWLFDLQQSAETRTNLALVNVGSADSSADTFRIDLYDGATGKKAGSTAVTVPAKGFLQLDAVLARNAPGVTQGYALVTRTSGSNPFLAFATVVDGSEPGTRSGDGAFVAAVVPDAP